MRDAVSSWETLETDTIVGRPRCLWSYAQLYQKAKEMENENREWKPLLEPNWGEILIGFTPQNHIPPHIPSPSGSH